MGLGKKGEGRWGKKKGEGGTWKEMRSTVTSSKPCNQITTFCSGYHGSWPFFSNGSTIFYQYLIKSCNFLSSRLGFLENSVQVLLQNLQHPCSC